MLPKLLRFHSNKNRAAEGVQKCRKTWDALWHTVSTIKIRWQERVVGCRQGQRFSTGRAKGLRSAGWFRDSDSRDREQPCCFVWQFVWQFYKERPTVTHTLTEQRCGRIACLPLTIWASKSARIPGTDRKTNAGYKSTKKLERAAARALKRRYRRAPLRPLIYGLLSRVVYFKLTFQATNYCTYQIFGNLLQFFPAIIARFVSEVFKILLPEKGGGGRGRGKNWQKSRFLEGSQVTSTCVGGTINNWMVTGNCNCALCGRLGAGGSPATVAPLPDRAAKRKKRKTGLDQPGGLYNLQTYIWCRHRAMRRVIVFFPFLPPVACDSGFMRWLLRTVSFDRARGGSWWCKQVD